MKKLSLMLTLVLVLGMTLMMVHLISAQQRGEGRQNQARDRQFDPQQMMERRMQQIMQSLKLSEEEAAVLKPKIENLQRMRMQQGQDMRPLTENLQKAVDAKDADQIKSSLAAFKAKRAEQKAALDKAEKELIELLTVEQEANLTLMGVVNSDGFGFRFGGGPQGGPGQGPQGPPGQGPQGAPGQGPPDNR